MLDSQYDNIGRRMSKLIVIPDVHGRTFWKKVLPELSWLREEDWKYSGRELSHAMYIRLFVRFIVYFGVIEFSGERHHDCFWTSYNHPVISVTPLLYELIDVDEPAFEGPELSKINIVDN